MKFRPFRRKRDIKNMYRKLSSVLPTLKTYCVKNEVIRASALGFNTYCICTNAYDKSQAQRWMVKSEHSIIAHNMTEPDNVRHQTHPDSCTFGLWRSKFCTGLQSTSIICVWKQRRLWWVCAYTYSQDSPEHLLLAGALRTEISCTGLLYMLSLEATQWETRQMLTFFARNVLYGLV